MFYTYYCIKCDRGSNKLIGICLSRTCGDRMAEASVYLRYLRRFRPYKYRQLAL